MNAEGQSELESRIRVPVTTAEVFVIPLDHGQYIVYAPLRRTAFVANARVVNVLADLAGGRHYPQDAADQAVISLLTQLQIVDGQPEISPITTVQGEPLPTTVTLFLTTACNLRCTYCYASAGDTPLRMMSLETAKRGIGFVALNALKKNASEFTVGFHGGGEPTLNWRVMTQAVLFARERAAALGLAVNVTAASNGVLGDTKTRWIISNLDGLSLSFDGPQEVNNSNRVTASGRGSSSHVIRTLKQLDAARFTYSLAI